MQNATELDAQLRDAFEHDDAIEHTITPLWREARWGLEWAQLRWSPVFLGCGVKQGRREPVLLIPGFMAGDLLMLELHRWLKRIGYRSSLSRIHWNNDCPERTAVRLMHRVRQLSERTGQKVNLVGHSLGGMLSRSLAQRCPEYIDRVITLGSPFRSLVRAHPAVIGLWDELKLAQGGLIGRNLHASCGTGHCTCDFVRHMSLPHPTPLHQYAIYSRKDGVADWRSCVNEDHTLNDEVDASHIGMVLHAGTYRAIARRLAEGRDYHGDSARNAGNDAGNES